jgi:DNA-binding transcriptional MerR regulator
LPVTLRAWERRYKLFKPQRTSGNYRLYSDRDIALLRWIKSRVDQGAPISRVTEEFHSLRRSGQWPQPVPAPPAPTRESAIPPEVYAKRLYG